MYDISDFDGFLIISNTAETDSILVSSNINFDAKLTSEVQLVTGVLSLGDIQHFKFIPKFFDFLDKMLILLFLVLTICTFDQMTSGEVLCGWYKKAVKSIMK